ncbi:MAG: ABC transporter permease [Spirochaetales bacterium]|nr:ABC transporter permease [Spirochaetales bacterium]MCF7938370.1 ABC transporter permease [Spirochaetales bacterium]
MKSNNRLFYIAVFFIILLGVAALAAPLISPFDPTDQELTLRFAEPGTEGHLLGTDDLGRDIFSRIIYGSRSALMVGVVSVGIALTIGLFVGLAAGLAGGTTDNILMLFMDSLLSFPTILLAITVVSVLGYGLLQVISAIGIIFSPVFARLVRAETMALKTEGFVESSRALGSRTWKTVFLHILPNMLGKITVQCSITFALSVVIEASLSYLGLGTQPPNPSWGLMLKDARNFMVQAPWMAVYPGLAIAFTVLSFNILGDSVSERVNPIAGKKFKLE